jgi:4-alpha-glucanotransferase
MKFERSSGILLHPTSLPGPFGIGDIGPQAFRWVDFLAGSGCTLWQMLPLGPTGFGDSPYQCFSAFAGNPYLISPQALVEDGLLWTDDLTDLPDFSPDVVDYGPVIDWKIRVLKRAFGHFQGRLGDDMRSDFIEFRRQNQEWLEDFALFMALKDAHDGAPWIAWEDTIRKRDPQALELIRIQLADDIDRHAFWQFIFFRQWQALREHANSKQITLIGDIPIFIAHDSADVWSHQELFYLDDFSRPKFQSGVPPDYFSPTGQLWGNPLYRWRVHRASGYQWWINRVRSVLYLVDLVRLDHFRGYSGYWQVSGRAKTAEKGRWVKAPGMDFLFALQKALGELPFIAEDLGVITPDVVKLRQTFNLPGMKILQFAFAGDPKDTFLPHNYPVHCVVYTGTHDNDTIKGWYERVPENEKAFYRRYLDRDGTQVSWDLIRACWASVAEFTLAPMQDFLRLGNEARMNYPGNPSGNWTWRMCTDDLSADLMVQIREINYLYDRLNPELS